MGKALHPMLYRIHGISLLGQDGVRHLLALREDSEARCQAPDASGCLVNVAGDRGRPWFQRWDQ